MLTREEILSGYPEELEAFGSLIDELDEGAWAKPTRCAGWTVGDVAAHVIGTLADVLGGRLDLAGTPDWTVRQVDERRESAPSDLRAELDALRPVGSDVIGSFDDEAWHGPAPAPITGTLGAGVEALWYDTFVHGDDIRAAIGAPSVAGPGLRASVHHVAGLLAERGWGPATLDLDGIEQIDIGSGGLKVAGDPLEFVLVATGRADPGRFGLGADVNVYGS